MVFQTFGTTVHRPLRYIQDASYLFWKAWFYVPTFFWVSQLACDVGFLFESLGIFHTALTCILLIWTTIVLTIDTESLSFLISFFSSHYVMFFGHFNAMYANQKTG